MEHLVEMTSAEDIHRAVRDALVPRRVEENPFHCPDVLKYIAAQGIEYEMFSHPEAFDDIPCVDVEWFAEEMFAMESRNARNMGIVWSMMQMKGGRDDVDV